MSVYDLGRALLAQREAMRAERDEAIRQRDEARAVLAPLLDDPWRNESEGPYWALDWFQECVWCASRAPDHAADCPVLRRDALLGRDQAPAHPEGDAT